MLNLDQMRETVRRTLGVDAQDDGWGDTDIDLLLNKAYWELLDKIPFREKEKTVTFSTEEGVRSYNVPSPFEALRMISVKDPVTSKHKKLERMTPAAYEENYNEDEDEQTFPTHYVREGCAVKLYPTPDQAYTVTMKYLTVLDDLSDDNDEPEIPQVWHELIEEGAIARGFKLVGDINRAEYYRKSFERGVSQITPTEAKEEKDNRYSGVEVMLPSYDL